MENNRISTPWLAAAITLICLLGVLPSSKPALSAATPWVSTDVAQIRLIGTYRNDDLKIGLHIRLEPGWKTYWRSPGDSGFPTMVDWSGSANVVKPTLRWPLPKRAVLSGYQSFVYGDEVVLPVSAEVVDRTVPVSLKAAVDYAVCKEVCVPLQADLSLQIEPQTKTAAAADFHAKLIDRYSARVPSREPHGGFEIGSAVVEQAGGQERLVVTLKAPDFGDPDVIVEAASPFSFSAPVVRLEMSGGRAVMSLAVYGGKSGASLVGQNVTITAYDGERAVERVVLLKQD